MIGGRGTELSVAVTASTGSAAIGGRPGRLREDGGTAGPI
jgi:hypothetical protein